MSTVDDKVEHNLSHFNSSLSSSYYLNMVCTVFMEIKNLYRIEKVLFASLILGSLFVFMILSDNPTTISTKYAIKNTSIPRNHPSIDLNNPLEREILEDEARLVPGLGRGGKPIKLNKLQATISDIFLKKFAVNIFLSDRIPYNRTLQDLRNPKCMDIVYDAELPSTSIIIPLHNEVYSVVVRMLWGIINSVARSNPVYDLANYETAKGEKMQLGSKGQRPDSQLLYLKEIILVDDQSSSGKFRKKLNYYAKTRMPAGLVKIVALKKRVGLIRARMEGARQATGDVIVFLDGHCEVQNDWLRPLLQNLKDNSTLVLFPIIDTIDIPDFSYSASDSFAIGGFAVDGDFAFLDVSEREAKRRGSDIALTWSPTMAGGLFAMRRSYFWHLGGYDEQMQIWGGENLEMSFRIWQCGGTLAATPCSRVGHLFRPFHPYARDSTTGSIDPMDTVVLNAARMAEVWMDEYSESFYLYRPTYRNNPIVGNVTERQMLRKKLNCKSFRWFLENIFPEKYVPGADSVGFGRFLNPITKTCLKNIHEMTYPFPLKTEGCGSILQPLLFLSLTLQGQIRDEYRCLFVKDSKPIKEVYFEECKVNKKSQKWIYHPGTRHLQHVLSDLCLEAPLTAGSIPLAVPCNVTRKEQIWFIEYSNASLQYRHTIKHESEAQAQRLAKLAGHEVVHVDIKKYTESAPELIDY